MSSLQTRIGIFLGAAVLAASPAFAADNGLIDSASVEFGSGKHVRLARVALQSNWEARWLASKGRHLGGYWDVSAAYWRGSAYRNEAGRHQNLAVIGFTPVLRYGRDDGLGWYAEGGIGANLFSELYRNADDRLSTAFQFGDHFGVGYVTANKWDLTVKFQHYSNASIKRPNTGVNFLVAGARYKF
ncbi:acyloxyacyl hydrolase [Massilia sp. Dwa41.01b]|uniref:acyloxyacyl hydrolase n=1 Tax=unclassified Massilia TaxID=2609279 RepID=UPI0016038E32|nr:MULTISPECIES: acyloxyacyl hydrolase [unclassified Massilia]QNA87507.1 acyloxyacyl hydrolase [Massilia sp. Dwa41.01b]QNA98414.1 acyloxyacyl hydrolase [Massilia sp. Se16.2.3]